METLDAIRSRRSIKRLTEPAPSDAELRTMLEAAVLAPDHKELAPWRFILLRSPAKEAFTDVLVSALKLREPGATEGQLDKARNALGRAPLVIAVAAKAIPAKIPFEELFAAAAAATQNLLLAATDLGYGAIWRTGAHATDSHVKAALGLDASDAIVGFVYIGTIDGEAPPPKAAVIDGVVGEWQPA